MYVNAAGPNSESMFCGSDITTNVIQNRKLQMERQVEGAITRAIVINRWSELKLCRWSRAHWPYARNNQPSSDKPLVFTTTQFFLSNICLV